MLPKRKRGQKQDAMPGTYDEAFEAAVDSEEQAERYRFGEKGVLVPRSEYAKAVLALRRYEKARDLYAAAIQFDSSKVDAIFNRGRVLYTLATVFAGRDSATHQLEEAIAHYRQAILLQKDSFDIRFNLAQALVEAGDVESSSQYETWKEALEHFQMVESEQMSLLQLAPVNNLPDTIPDEVPPDSANTEATFAETQTIVPSIVIETLLAQVDLISQMLDSGRFADVSSNLQQAAADALARAKELDINKYDTTAIILGEAALQLSILEANVGPATQKIEPCSLVLDQVAALSQSQPDNIECWSQYADTLLTLVDFCLLAHANRSQQALSSATQAFQQLATRLGSPLTARGVPVQSIAPTLSKSFGELAWLALCSEDTAKALQYAVDAVRTSETGCVLDLQTGKLRRSPGRADVAALDALEAAVLTAIRVSITIESSVSPHQPIPKYVEMLRVAGVSPTAVQEYAEEALSDGLTEERGNKDYDQSIWTNLLNALQS